MIWSYHIDQGERSIFHDQATNRKGRSQHFRRCPVFVSDTALSSITGAAATSCFGVKGMAYRSMTDGIVHLLRREAMSKGVRIIPHEEGDISIELHIVVEHGVNIAAVCRSIINQVRYMVSENTGASIRSIDVCVDSMNL